LKRNFLLIDPTAMLQYSGVFYWFSLRPSKTALNASWLKVRLHRFLPYLDPQNLSRLLLQALVTQSPGDGG
jgi:hypothetical protein